MANKLNCVLTYILESASNYKKYFFKFEVIMTSRYLGAAGKGQISLFIANIVMVQHVGNLISGGSLVYLTPRIKPMILF